MKRVALGVGAMLAVGMFAVMVAVTARAAAAGDAPVVSSLGPLMQKEIHWGMSHLEVVDAYNKPTGIFDQEYASKLAHLQPGSAMDELESERDSRKSNLTRSYTEFLDSPTGYDVTPLRGEFSYNNGEATQRILRDGKARYFFYIKDRLWKIYDETPLAADGPLGATYSSALAKLGGLLGLAPRVRSANSSQGIERTTADWQDGSTHLRAVDRSGEHLVGIVLEDKRTVSNLASLRSNKAADPFALDPSVSALTRGGISDPNAGRQGGDAGTKKHK
jgi:hypothetical protein